MRIAIHSLSEGEMKTACAALGGRERPYKKALCYYKTDFSFATLSLFFHPRKKLETCKDRPSKFRHNYDNS
ncbi:hypothetical protein IMPR6_110122 [Imperialibacter sp. EC-SDR9]|nr:hypothetical protein IMPERIA75_340122 [Imperialibacter sp. 75]CAD5280390.1 hypothetical protein IMPERIA89_460061 [Imperialibacter sp. 89]VVT01395.1 hypothetical protein IMPR6_110122 [Imperialibacter sp. EC-SDR9]